MIIAVTQTITTYFDVPGAASLNEAAAELYGDGEFRLLREERGGLEIAEATEAEVG